MLYCTKFGISICCLFTFIIVQCKPFVNCNDSRHCLWCNDMVYSSVLESLSDLFSGFENSKKALPTLAYIMNEIPASSVSSVHKGVIQTIPERMFKRYILIV